MLKGAKFLDALLSEKHYTTTNMGLSFISSHVSPAAQNISKSPTPIQSSMRSIQWAVGASLLQNRPACETTSKAFSGEGVLGKLK